MSKEKPEVGDVWLVSHYGANKKVYICNTKDYIHPLYVVEDGETGFMFECEKIKYLGKSKVSIEELFDVAED